jgi:hypothetical protein
MAQELHLLHHQLMLVETTHLIIHGTLPPDCFTLSKGSGGEKAVLSGRLFFALILSLAEILSK